MAGSVRLSVLFLLTLDALQTSRVLPKSSLQHSSNIRHSMQVKKALQQQQMLQAAGGIEGLVALLQTSLGDTSTQQTTTIIFHHHTYHTGLEAAHPLTCKAVHIAKPNCCYAHRACFDCAGSAGICTWLSTASMQTLQVDPVSLVVNHACKFLFVTCSGLTLASCAGTNALPADTLASYAAMMCRTLPAVVVPAALKKVKDAQSHEECLQALQYLHMLCSRHTVSCC